MFCDPRPQKKTSFSRRPRAASTINDVWSSITGFLLTETEDWFYTTERDKKSEKYLSRVATTQKQHKGPYVNNYWRKTWFFTSKIKVGHKMEDVCSQRWSSVQTNWSGERAIQELERWYCNSKEKTFSCAIEFIFKYNRCFFFNALKDLNVVFKSPVFLLSAISRLENVWL